MIFFIRLLSLFAILGSFSLKAVQYETSLTLGTDSLRRGLSITERQASVRVAGNLELPFGLYTGLNVTNTGEKEAMGFLMEFNLGYGIRFLDHWKVSPEVRGFYNPFMLVATTFETGLSLSFLEDHKISVWYSPHYFANGSFTLYTSIQSAYNILEWLRIEGSVGYQYFGDTKKASQTSYVDTKWSLWHLSGDHALGMTFSITNREKIDAKSGKHKKANDWAFLGEYKFKLKP